MYNYTGGAGSLNLGAFSAGTAGTIIYVVCDAIQNTGSGCAQDYTGNANEVAIFIYSGGWRKVSYLD